MLELVYENHVSEPKWDQKFFSNIIEGALKFLNLNDKQVEIGLQLINSKRSQELNFKYRGKDKPTDVLSFPLNENPADNILKKHDILPLGDIFICLDVAVRQAEEMRVSVSEELARLAVHGLLHLLGYDHERSAEDEKKMLSLQEEILETIN